MLNSIHVVKAETFVNFLIKHYSVEFSLVIIKAFILVLQRVEEFRCSIFNLSAI